MALTGSCLCGEITYTVEGDDHIVAVCHCEHCQRQSGAPFSHNLVSNVDAMTINGPIKTYEDRGENGDAVYVLRKFCPTCGSPIVSQPMEPEGMIVIKIGTIDNRNELPPPIAQAWCVNKQPWVDMPFHAMDTE